MPDWVLTGILVTLAIAIITAIARGCYILGEHASQLTAHDGIMSRTEAAIKVIESELKSIRDIAFKIAGALTSRGILPGDFVRAASPMALTDGGVKMLEDSGFVDIYKIHGQKMLDAIEAKKPNLKYDAEEISIDVLLSMRDDPIMNPLKTYAYEHGISLTDMLVAAGVFVRDRVIEELRLAK